MRRFNELSARSRREKHKLNFRLFKQFLGSSEVLTVLKPFCSLVDRHVSNSACCPSKITMSSVTRQPQTRIYYTWEPIDDFRHLDWAEVRTTIKCPSCPKKFPCYINRTQGNSTKCPHPSFFHHCTVHCENHRNNLHFCKECNSVFVDWQLLKLHASSCVKIKEKNLKRKEPLHNVAVSKGGQIYNIAVPEISNPNWSEEIKCPGCKLAFGAVISDAGFLIPDVEYENHCLEQCDSYQKVVDIIKCNTCFKKFLNIQIFAEHEIKVHQNGDVNKFRISSGSRIKAVETLQLDTLEIVRELNKERSEKISLRKEQERLKELRAFKKYSNSLTGMKICYPPQLKTYNLRKQCPGCRRSFPAGISDDGRVLPHPLYYRHCINDCSKYLNLHTVTACCRCNTFFLYKIDFDEHDIKCRLSMSKQGLKRKSSRGKLEEIVKKLKTSKSSKSTESNDVVSVPQNVSTENKKSLGGVVQTPATNLKALSDEKSKPAGSTVLKQTSLEKLPPPLKKLNKICVRNHLVKPIDDRKSAKPSAIVKTPVKQAPSSQDSSVKAGSFKDCYVWSSSIAYSPTKRNRSQNTSDAADSFRFTSCIQELSTSSRCRGLRISTQKKTAQARSDLMARDLAKLKVPKSRA